MKSRRAREGRRIQRTPQACLEPEGSSPWPCGEHLRFQGICTESVPSIIWVSTEKMKKDPLRQVGEDRSGARKNGKEVQCGREGFRNSHWAGSKNWTRISWAGGLLLLFRDHRRVVLTSWSWLIFLALPHTIWPKRGFQGFTNLSKIVSKVSCSPEIFYFYFSMKTHIIQPLEWVDYPLCPHGSSLYLKGGTRMIASDSKSSLKSSLISWKKMAVFWNAVLWCGFNFLEWAMVK